MLSFGALTVGSVWFEVLEWHLRTHRTAYLAFFTTAGIALAFVFASFPDIH